VIPILFFAGMLVVFWLLVIQPQRRRREQQTRLLSDLAVGDDVITAGGLYGAVREVAEDHVVLEIAANTRVKVAKSAVAGRVEPEPDAEPETEPERLTQTEQAENTEAPLT
jgi:preprotein translocase subunit YajC